MCIQNNDHMLFLLVLGRGIHIDRRITVVKDPVHFDIDSKRVLPQIQAINDCWGSKMRKLNRHIATIIIYFPRVCV